VQEIPNSQLILSRDVVACDTETTGLDWWKGDRVFGASLSWFDDNGKVQSFYGDVRDPNIHRWFQDHLPLCKRVTNHFTKFDAHILRESGIQLPLGKLGCTMVQETLLDEDQYEYSLDRLSWKYLNRGKKDIWPRLAELFGGEPNKKSQIANLVRAPRELVEEYANTDSANALLVDQAQLKILAKEDLTHIHKLEMNLMKVVIGLEHGGVRVDLDRAEQAAEYLDKDVKRQQKELDRMVGYPINVNSPIQVKKLLGVHQKADGTWWTKDGVRLEPTESGKSGSLKTEKLYQCTMPEARYIAEIRGEIKARDTFLRKYILEMSHDEYVHASINQTRTEEGDGTYTGRFSITDPALQQIHKRNKKLAAIVRSCFIPDEGTEWGCYDWSQKDFRIFAHYVNDPKINAIYAANPAADFHRVTSDITGLPRDRDEKTGGANAKQMNLGLIFGMSAGRMAKEMFLPYTLNEKGYYVAGPEAEALFAKYHDNIPGANRLKQSVASIARSRGYIKTLLGRRLRFPDPNKAYKAAGVLFQGQAAEDMKVKMVELDNYLEENPVARFMLVVHDEYDLNMNIGRDLKHDAEIKHLLERFDGVKTPIKLRIPILSDYGVGPNWWEASK
jgi:DNA polymerase-1